MHIKIEIIRRTWLSLEPMQRFTRSSGLHQWTCARILVFKAFDLKARNTYRHRLLPNVYRVIHPRELLGCVYTVNEYIL